MHPLAAATLGALLTTWVTFLPSFLMVFLGVPHVEGLRDRPAVAAVPTAISAVVAGVVSTILWLSSALLGVIWKGLF